MLAEIDLRGMLVEVTYKREDSLVEGICLKKD